MAVLSLIAVEMFISQPGSGGGASGCGLVFQLAPSGGGWTENIMYDFPGSPACSPEGDLLRDDAGNFL